jgi:hypothetical protein
MKFKKFTTIIVLAVFAVFSGCKKYLEAKSNKSLVVISNLQDLQSLLDNFSDVNLASVSADEVSTDEYYLSDETFQALPFEQMRNMYTWQPYNLFYPYTNLPNDWTQVYTVVQKANTVLDNMHNVQRTVGNATAWDDIRGQALFLRAFAFSKGAAIWSLAYDSNTSDTELGISLRLTSNFNVKSTRSTVAQTYNQIISDTKTAASLLPNSTIHPYRACKAAAYGLLAKTYLAMRQYNLAGLYADSCLQINKTLVDFNNYDSTKYFPIEQFNKEIIYDTAEGGVGSIPLVFVYAKIDTNLFRSYDTNDLRKTLFFRSNADGSVFFSGSYDGSSTIFNGIATDEIYLIRAECYARSGNENQSMSDLNLVLEKRFKAGTFVPLTALNSNDALTKVLYERHKELIMRGTRWTDIKRLNKEGAGISLKRNVNGNSYILPANNLRFALPLPDDIVSLSGMQQNPR